MSDLTDYEEARLANIRKNNELLQSLGLSTGVSLNVEKVMQWPKVLHGKFLIQSH